MLRDASASTEKIIHVSLPDILDYVSPLALERFENYMFKYPELEKGTELVTEKTRRPLGRPLKEIRVGRRADTHALALNGSNGSGERARARARQAEMTRSACPLQALRGSTLRYNSSTSVDTQEDELALGTRRIGSTGKKTAKQAPAPKAHASNTSARDNTSNRQTTSNIQLQNPSSKRQTFSAADAGIDTSASASTPTSSHSGRKRKRTPPILQAPPHISSLDAVVLPSRSATSSSASRASSMQLLQSVTPHSARVQAGAGEEEMEYEIDAILADALVDGIEFYQVKWAGYPEDESSWLPETDLEGAEELLEEYKAGRTWVESGGRVDGAAGYSEVDEMSVEDGYADETIRMDGFG